VRFHIRKVQIVPSFYYGYKVFDHFLWHSEQPEGFFEIQALGNTVFQVWNQGIDKISLNRRYCL
jgi:hypothetical protein